MDILVEKQYKDYPYISRYESFPFYYNPEDKRYIYGITGHLAKNITYISHKVEDYDTLDSLAFKYYGRPDLYWAIADFNDIRDPFISLKSRYLSIKIPSISSIYFEG